MILKNKRTQKTLAKFKTQFVKEIRTAFESYKQTELAKPNFNIKNVDESDFYFDLQWNFNHHAHSDWCIEKL